MDQLVDRKSAKVATHPVMAVPQGQGGQRKLGGFPRARPARYFPSYHGYLLVGAGGDIG